MGCDIHMVVEMREKDYPHWYQQGTFRGCRYYELFAHMNREVRNYKNVSGFEERGLPADSYLAGDDEYDRKNREEYLGDHSFSWLTLEEFKEAIHDTIRFEGERFGNLEDYEAIVAFMDYHEKHGNHTRLLFGFDS